MNRITPEVIFDRFATRLKSKIEDFEYIRYAEQGFEKWAEVELLLSFKDVCYPILYDENGKVICADNEPIADIRLQYHLPGMQPIRPDLFITASPMHFKFGLSDHTLRTWQVKEEEKKVDLINHYNKTPVHYIELKVDWWIHNKDYPKGFVDDCEKIFKKDGTYKKFNAASRMAISIVTFSTDKVDINDMDISSKISKLAEKVKMIEPVAIFLHTKINEYTSLVGAYKLESR